MRRRQKPGTISRSKRLRDNATDMERLLWWKLRELNARGYHFRRQVPLRGYFLDFAEHSGRVAIELDGSQHGLRENLAHDAKRDRTIEEEGYRVLRFWNRDVKDNLDGVMDAILREINQRRPPTRIASLSDLPTRGR